MLVIVYKHYRRGLKETVLKKTVHLKLFGGRNHSYVQNSNITQSLEKLMYQRQLCTHVH